VSIVVLALFPGERASARLWPTGNSSLRVTARAELTIEAADTPGRCFYSITGIIYYLLSNIWKKEMPWVRRANQKTSKNNFLGGTPGTSASPMELSTGTPGRFRWFQRPAWMNCVPR